MFRGDGGVGIEEAAGGGGGGSATHSLTPKDLMSDSVHKVKLKISTFLFVQKKCRDTGCVTLLFPHADFQI